MSLEQQRPPEERQRLHALLTAEVGRALEDGESGMTLFPSEEVVNGWVREWMNDPDESIPHRNYIAIRAADWQLEQVCDFLNSHYPQVPLSALLDAMRPKPKSLAELAIEEWDYLKSDLESDLARQGMGISKCNIEKALEKFKELEAQQ